MIAISIVRVDATGLNMFVEAARKFNRRTPARAANVAAGWVAYRWLHGMPVVSPSRIDTELSVVTTPILSTKGKRKGLPLKSGRKNYQVTEGGLATMIVLARLHRGSRYNMLTNQRFALDQATFSPGDGQAGFWRKLELVAQRMVASRHSSIAFLKSAVATVYWAMRPYMRGNSPGILPIDAGRRRGMEKGHVVPAREGDVLAVCLISADIGVAGLPANQLQKYNDALWRYGAPALQRAVDQEAAAQFKYAVERGWVEDVKNPMRSLGIGT